MCYCINCECALSAILYDGAVPRLTVVGSLFEHWKLTHLPVAIIQQNPILLCTSVVKWILVDSLLLTRAYI